METKQIILIILGAQSFITTLGIAGSVAGGIEGILILFIFRKAKKLGKRKPEYSFNVPLGLSGVLIALFIAGILSIFI